MTTETTDPDYVNPTQRIISATAGPPVYLERGATFPVLASQALSAGPMAPAVELQAITPGRPDHHPTQYLTSAEALWLAHALLFDALDLIGDRTHTFEEQEALRSIASDVRSPYGEDLAKQATTTFLTHASIPAVEISPEVADAIRRATANIRQGGFQ